MSKLFSALREAEQERKLREEAQARPGAGDARDSLPTPRPLGTSLPRRPRYEKKYRLGDILVETNTITEKQLEVALEEQRKTRLRLGEVLVRLNFVTERQVKEALAKQLGITFVDLDQLVIDQSLARLTNRRFAQRHRIIPIAKSGNRIYLAMDDPANVDVIEELAALTGWKIEVVTSTAAAFQRTFALAYGESPEAGSQTRIAPRPEADTLRLLGTERGQTAQAPRVSGEAHARALADLEAARAALREERAVSARALRELAEQAQATERALAELRAADETLRGELAATREALRQASDALARERQEATEAIEAVLRLLKP